MIRNLMLIALILMAVKVSAQQRIETPEGTYYRWEYGGGTAETRGPDGVYREQDYGGGIREIQRPDGQRVRIYDYDWPRQQQQPEE